MPLLRLRLRNAPTELSLLLYQLSSKWGITIDMRHNGVRAWQGSKSVSGYYRHDEAPVSGSGLLVCLACSFILLLRLRLCLATETPRVPRRLDYLEATVSRAAC